MPKYRLLTAAEIASAASAFEELATWSKFATFVQATYPATAHRMEITTHGEYDDEGGTDWWVDEIVVTDRDGDRLYYDLTKPLFTSTEPPTSWGKSFPAYWDEAARREHSDEENHEVAENWIREYDINGEMNIFKGPKGTTVWLVNQPPTETYAELYVKEEE